MSATVTRTPSGYSGHCDSVGCHHRADWTVEHSDKRQRAGKLYACALCLASACCAVTAGDAGPIATGGDRG